MFVSLCLAPALREIERNKIPLDIHEHIYKYPRLISSLSDCRATFCSFLLYPKLPIVPLASYLENSMASGTLS